jgi:tetratricopeptide (TPR) repeat protein
MQTRYAKQVNDAKTFWADCERDLTVFVTRIEDLRKHQEKLEKAIALENDPTVIARRKKVEAILFEAETQLQQCDYEKAMAHYEEAIKLSVEEVTAQDKLKAILTEVRKRWTIKDAEHATARRFIYESWGKLEKLKEIREQLPAARKAFEKCKAVDDRISITKMHLLAAPVLESFTKRLKDAVEAATEDEDREVLRPYLKVNEDLNLLLQNVGEYLGVGRKK